MASLRRRTRLFVARRFQIRYITLILVLMFAVALLSGYTVYVTTWIIFGEKLAAVYPQGLLLDIINKVNAVLLLRLLFISPLVFLIGLVLSNRIAGPIYRIKRYLARVASGSYSSNLKLRERDEFQDLAGSINNLVYKLRSNRNKKAKKIAEIRALLANCKSAAHDSERIKNSLTEIEGLLDSVERT